jgi:hypothetical protein
MAVVVIGKQPTPFHTKADVDPYATGDTESIAGYVRIQGCCGHG